MSVLSLSYSASNVRTTNISQSLPHKWQKTADMKKLRHCHPMYNAPQHQSFSDINLALQIMVASIAKNCLLFYWFAFQLIFTVVQKLIFCCILTLYLKTQRHVYQIC